MQCFFCEETGRGICNKCSRGICKQHGTVESQETSLKREVTYRFVCPECKLVDKGKI